MQRHSVCPPISTSVVFYLATLLVTGAPAHAGKDGANLPLSQGTLTSAPSQSADLERIRVDADIRAPRARYRSLTGVWQQINIRAEGDPLPSLRGGARPAQPPERGTPIQSSTATTESTPLPGAPATSGDFDSTDFDDSFFIPADPIAAAGPDHVVNVTNGRLRFHQKGGTQDFDDSLSDFFSSLNPDGPFDPKVIFDQYEGRFVIVALDLADDGMGGDPETASIYVAVSDDADPNGTWYFADIDSVTEIGGTDHWADYPGLAVDEEVVYITNNMFKFSADGGSYGGVRLWVIDKGVTGGFYDGNSASVSLFDPYAGGGFATTTQPAHLFGSPPAGLGTFLVSYSGFSDGTNESLQFVRLDDPLTSPAFTQQFIGIGDIDDTNASMPDAPQPDSSFGIETNDRRALHAVWFDDTLWITATVVPNSGDPDAGEATAYWWQLDTSTPGSPVVDDRGGIGGEDIADGTYTYFPSVAFNGAGQVVFGFSASAPTEYVGSYYTTRETGDPAGGNSGSATLRAGTAPYERTYCGADNRWGDYSGTAVDPTDGGFWVYNKHAISTGSASDSCDNNDSDENGRWSTAYGNFILTDACPADMFLATETYSSLGVVEEAASAIRTGASVTVSATGGVTFRAGERVALNEGFSVEAGGTLSIEITANPCLL